MKFESGDTFEGIWLNDKMSFGKYTSEDGTVYRGTFNNNTFHGQGELQLTDGRKACGTFKNGELAPEAKLIFVSGDVFEGKVANYRINKQGTMRYMNGDVYEGFWKQSDLHLDPRSEFYKDAFREGFGTLFSQDGSKYVGKWRDDKKNGQGKEYILSKGELYQGEFEENFRHGHGRLITNKLEVFDGEWIRGERITPKRTSKYIQRKVFDKMVNNFMREKSEHEPHIVILS